MDTVDTPEPIETYDLPPPREATSGSVPEVLRVALPMILAAGTHAVQLFADRVMLSYVSSHALSACMSAGITGFTLSCIFVGTIGYVSTFVAQYTGARRDERVGIALWQALYLALGAGALLTVGGTLFAEPIFRFFDHAPAVRVDQIAYFRILISGAVFHLATTAMAGFYTGRGRTWTVVAIASLSTAINLAFNYVFIYGYAGNRALLNIFGSTLGSFIFRGVQGMLDFLGAQDLQGYGIVGAGLGTVLGIAVGTVVYFVLFLRRTNRHQYGTWPGRKLDLPLLGRLVRFGLPDGVRMVLDVASFNFFVVLIGRMGEMEQTAGTIAFSMNAIAFIPMIGIGMASSVLVGQAIGAQDTPHAERAVKSALKIALLYAGAMSALFVFTPDVFVTLFEADEQTYAMARRFMLYIAGYIFFDAMYMVYHSAIKGAGDTSFAMWVGVGMAWGLFALPCYLAWRFGRPVGDLWTILVAYIVLAGIVFYLRYRGGKWRTMRVIEH